MKFSCIFQNLFPIKHLKTCVKRGRFGFPPGFEQGSRSREELANAISLPGRSALGTSLWARSPGGFSPAPSLRSRLGTQSRSCSYVAARVSARGSEPSPARKNSFPFPSHPPARFASPELLNEAGLSPSPNLAVRTAFPLLLLGNFFNFLISQTSLSENILLKNFCILQPVVL